MVAHRALQRALFRMQLDAGFAAALRARDPSAERSTRLGPQELSWLRNADPAAISADRGGARRAQLLRNVSSELALTSTRLSEGVLDGFTCSPELHEAVCRERPLPIALTEYLLRVVPPLAREARALLELERGLMLARRTLRDVRAPAGDEVVLAPWAWLLTVPAGTLALAEALRLEAAPAASMPAPSAPGSLGEELETLLIIGERAPTPFRLREVTVERLPEAVAQLLRRAEQPLSRDERARFARGLDAEPDDVETLVEDLVKDGALLTTDSR